MYAENLVRLIDSDEWIQIPMTNMLKSYLYRVSDDLKTDLLSGIRQFYFTFYLGHSHNSIMMKSTSPYYPINYAKINLSDTV